MADNVARNSLFSLFQSVFRPGYGTMTSFVRTSGNIELEVELELELEVEPTNYYCTA
jgi:hypothetical protein